MLRRPWLTGGCFIPVYSLYFEKFAEEGREEEKKKSLAGINSLKAASLSTVCSLQPLNSKTERIEGAQETEVILVSKEN